jgi:hypothetical protein
MSAMLMSLPARNCVLHQQLACGRQGRQLAGCRRRMPCNATPTSRPMQTPEIYYKPVITGKGFPDQAQLKTTLHTLFRSHSPCTVLKPVSSTCTPNLNFPRPAILMLVIRHIPHIISVRSDVCRAVVGLPHLPTKVEFHTTSRSNVGD